MERKFQALLDKILRQIFIKKVASSEESRQEIKSEGPPLQKQAGTIVAFVFSGPALQRRPPEYYQSPEYFARLRQKMQVCFKQEKEVICTSDPGESFEKKLRINEIEDLMDEIVLLEYTNGSLLEKIARMEELQEIYRKMVRNRQPGY